MEFFDESYEFIVWSNLIEHLFPTLLASVSDHISFIFAIIDPHRFHESVTRRKTISWHILIYMHWVEASWAVIACWACRMDSNVMVTVSTGEGLIAHDEGHIWYLKKDWTNLLPIDNREGFFEGKIVRKILLIGKIIRICEGKNIGCSRLAPHHILAIIGSLVCILRSGDCPIFFDHGDRIPIGINDFFSTCFLTYELLSLFELLRNEWDSLLCGWECKMKWYLRIPGGDENASCRMTWIESTRRNKILRKYKRIIEHCSFWRFTTVNINSICMNDIEESPWENGCKEKEEYFHIRKSEDIYIEDPSHAWSL